MINAARTRVGDDSSLTSILPMHDQKKGAVLATDTPEKISKTSDKLSPTYDKSTRKIDIGIDEKIARQPSTCSSLSWQI